MNIIKHSLATSLLVAIGAAGLHGSNLIAFDPFHSTSSSEDADPAGGLYYSNVNAGSGSLDSEANRSTSGGGIVGFGGNDWQGSHTTFRIQNSRLSSPSRTELADGAVRVQNFRGGTGGPSTAFRVVSRDLDAYTPSSTYYMSSIVSAFTEESGNAPNAFFMLGFGNDLISDSSVMDANSSSLFEGVMWGFRANETGDQLDLVMRATSDAGTNAVQDFVLVEDIVQQHDYFVSLRVDVNEAGADDITVWVDPDFGLTDPSGGMSFQADAFSSAGAITQFASMQQGMLHSGGNNSVNRIGYFDGIAMGDSYAAVVPEPSTYALILGGAFLLVALRCRRR